MAKFKIEHTADQLQRWLDRNDMKLLKEVKETADKAGKPQKPFCQRVIYYRLTGENYDKINVKVVYKDVPDGIKWCADEIKDDSTEQKEWEYLFDHDIAGVDLIDKDKFKKLVKEQKDD